MITEELKELTENKLREKCENLIPVLYSLIEDIENNDFKNKSWFLNFLDELNKISILW